MNLAESHKASLIVHTTNAINFIKKSEVPHDKTVTYSKMVCNYRPLKDNNYRIGLTVRGNKLPYNKDTASPTADLLQTKNLLNSTISDAYKGALFMGINVKKTFS